MYNPYSVRKIPRISVFPNRIVVDCNQPGGSGLAILLRFHCWHKNDYAYMVFLGESNRAKLAGKEALRWFDKERHIFLMHYDDLRNAWDGRVIAHAMGRAELSSALNAFRRIPKTHQIPSRL